jgi:hypothetical protein
MNDTTNILEFPSRCINCNELRAGFTRRVPFHLSLDDMPEDRLEREASAGRKLSKEIIHLPSANYYSLTDRVEYFLFSFLSGAALLSVLLWIFSLHNFEPAKAAPSAPSPAPRAESSLPTLN